MSKHCKYCRESVFKAVIKRPGIVSLEEKEPKIIKEIDGKFLYEVVECIKCGKKMSNEELVDTVICDACKKEVPSNSLLNGICVDCYIKKHRPDLDNLPKIELIKKILLLEKKENNL